MKGRAVGGLLAGEGGCGAGDLRNINVVMENCSFPWKRRKLGEKLNSEQCRAAPAMPCWPEHLL